MNTTYDNINWHLNNDGAVIPEKNAAVHIAMYLVWLIHRGMIRADVLADWGGVDIQRGKETPADICMSLTGGKLLEQFLNDDAVKFTDENYDPTYYQLISNMTVGLEHEDSGLGLGPYDLKDTWKNYDMIAAKLDELFGAQL